MKKLLKLLPILIITTMFQSCKKDNQVDISKLPFLGGDIWSKTSIDRWIYDTLTQPFNIEVKYKFDEFEQDLTKDLVPPKEDVVVPMLRTIKRIWIDPYVENAGDAFMKKLVPKQIVLVGSPSFNSDGTVTIGEAEGGKKILLYEVNYLDLTNRDQVIRMMHTIEHEFAHILHQNKMYDPAFKSICPGGDYTANWFNVSDAEAHGLGFVTPYSTSNYDDDFVETISCLLVQGQNYFDKLVNGQNAGAQAKLRAKEALIVEYFSKEWNIDFRALQLSVAMALNEVAPLPPLATNFGPGKDYNTIVISNDKFASNAHGAFGNALLSATDAVVSTYNIVTDSIYFKLESTDTLLLHIKTHPDDGSGDIYFADYRFKVTVNNDGSMSFGPALIFANRDGYNGSNADFFKDYLKPLLDFISAHHLTVTWPGGNPFLGLGSFNEFGNESSSIVGAVTYTGFLG